MPSVLQNNVALGREIVPTSMEAGDVIAKKFTYTFPVAGSAGDIVEIGILPAYCSFVDLNYMENGAITEGNIGIMAGAVGDKTLANRTIATNLITSGRANQAALDVAPVGYDRSIGVTITSAAQGATITLMSLFVQ